MKPKTNGIAEILATKQFPGVAMHGIKKPSRKKLGTHPGNWTRGCSRSEWIMENGVHEPVRVTGEMHHRTIQKEHNVKWIGDDGLQEVRDRVDERNYEVKKGTYVRACKKKQKQADPEQERLAKWWDSKGFDDAEKRKFGIS